MNPYRRESDFRYKPLLRRASRGDAPRGRGFAQLDYNSATRSVCVTEFCTRCELETNGRTSGRHPSKKMAEKRSTGSFLTTIFGRFVVLWSSVSVLTYIKVMYLEYAYIEVLQNTLVLGWRQTLFFSSLDFFSPSSQVSIVFFIFTLPLYFYFLFFPFVFTNN